MRLQPIQMARDWCVATRESGSLRLNSSLPRAVWRARVTILASARGPAECASGAPSVALEEKAASGEAASASGGRGGKLKLMPEKCLWEPRALRAHLPDTRVCAHPGCAHTCPKRGLKPTYPGTKIKFPSVCIFLQDFAKKCKIICGPIYCGPI